MYNPRNTGPGRWPRMYEGQRQEIHERLMARELERSLTTTPAVRTDTPLPHDMSRMMREALRLRSDVLRWKRRHRSRHK